jgi:hypothetical protein
MHSHCPHCKANLQGDAIPQDLIDKGYYAHDATHYSKIIGIELRGVYDGVLYWQCPECGGKWHRWPQGTYQRGLAERCIDD